MTTRRLSLSVLRVAAAAALLAAATLPARAADAQDYSQAERLVFMTDQLANLKPPATLHYSFRKSGTLEEGYSDGVTIKLAPQADGSCCTGSGEFLSGTHQFKVPEVEGAHANPVVLYFLERDIGEMHRLAKGAQNYFRKRIRMAIYEGATVQDVSLRYQGRAVPAKSVSVSPYLDDPVRSRYDKYARKRYTFYLADAVPGGVWGIRTVMSAESAAAAPLVVEEMFIDGADPAGLPSTP